MPECLKEEFADLPTTQQDYLNELPSRCSTQRTWLARFTAVLVSNDSRPGRLSQLGRWELSVVLKVVVPKTLLLCA